MKHELKRVKKAAPLKAIWNILSSMKTAVVLLLLVAAASVLGTVERLGLTDFYHTVWYNSLLALIGLNLMVCSINRFGATWRHARRIRQEQGVLILSIWGPYLTHLSLLVIFAGAILGSRLGFEGYTTIIEGKHAESCTLKSGPEKSLGFQVTLNKFTIEHDADHNVTGYKSDLAIYDNNKLAKKKVIDVNHPLAYKGISFYQVDYGLDCFILKITAPTGETAWIPFGIDTQNVPEEKQYVFTDSPLKQIGLGGKKLSIYVHNFAPDFISDKEINAGFIPINPAAQIMVSDRFPEYKGLDAWQQLGWLELYDSVKFKGFTITMEDITEYTSLQVAKNPGLPIIYAGFGLLLIGVFVSFYITRK